MTCGGRALRSGLQRVRHLTRPTRAVLLLPLPQNLLGPPEVGDAAVGGDVLGEPLASDFAFDKSLDAFLK